MFLGHFYVYPFCQLHVNIYLSASSRLASGLRIYIVHFFQLVVFYAVLSPRVMIRFEIKAHSCLDITKKTLCVFCAFVLLNILLGVGFHVTMHNVLSATVRVNSKW